MKKLLEFLVFSSSMCFLQPVKPFPQPDSKKLKRLSCTDPKEYPNNNVCCLSCEAGEYVKTHCTEAGKKGVCEECDFGTFMKYANGLEQCFKCTQCRSDQDMVSLCTHTQDTLCQCKAGRFCRPDQACEVCKKCSRCQSDEETVRNCTSTTDTECRKTLPKSTADSDAALVVGILVCVLILVFVGGVLIFICKRTRPTGPILEVCPESKSC
ncbi:tumor necrosis factor receptor superfamily member 26 [Nematolebias whitei]|uniref:tumor necrosis factor receptor superfamily member 26 n=1 Tax=Nematolebias whitei TaxID=451745 RepID=UPI001898819C|nr:tumor necrosis factor receptor superfamily member 26 [Nematolebias whitei]